MKLVELQRIGFTEGEIKVYEALLELGECTKTSLVKEAGIAPSNVYDITNRLVEKGIISKVIKNKVAHFSPANPKQLLSFLDQKEKEIADERKIVENLLPTLLAEYEETKEDVAVEVFQGWNGLKTIFGDLLDECSPEDTNCVFGASKGENDEYTERFFLKYSKLREKKGIKTNIIFNENVKEDQERIQFFVDSKNYAVRFLNQTTPTEIMVYKDTTCIIMLTSEPLTIRIQGEEVAKSFRTYFNVMWSLAKE